MNGSNIKPSYQLINIIRKKYAAFVKEIKSGIKEKLKKVAGVHQDVREKYRVSFYDCLFPDSNSSKTMFMV